LTDKLRNRTLYLYALSDAARPPQQIQTVWVDVKQGSRSIGEACAHSLEVLVLSLPIRVAPPFARTLEDLDDLAFVHCE
jgi:hypothetical protein